MLNSFSYKNENRKHKLFITRKVKYSYPDDAIT